MDYDSLRKKEIEQIVERLISQREKPSSERVKALEQLQVTASGFISFILLELLKTECDVEVLIFICNALARTKEEEAVMPLVDLVLGNREIEGKDDPVKVNRDEYLKVRCSAIKALGLLKNEKAVIPLMYVLNDKTEHYRVRLNAAEALGRIGDTYAVNPLINLVVDEKESSVYVRESAAKALGMLGDVRAIKPLLKILDSKRGIFDKFTFLKEQVIDAIRKIGADSDRDTVQYLKDSLMDEAPSVRMSAVETLASMGDPSLIRILVPVVYDEDEEVSREAVRAIYELEGMLELQKLLEDDRLPGWARDEIEMAFEEGE
jgi:HEAT repeat protein